MADQAKTAVSNVQEHGQNATDGTPVSGVQEKVKGATDGLLSKIDAISGWVYAKGTSIIDSIFPPEKRAAFLAKLQDFMLRNPKLSAFLGMNLLLTGIPLGLFVLFSLSVFIFSLVVALIVALLAAVIFTLFMVAVALIIVLPTVMFTTGAACFLFLWGLGGYHLLKWANGDGESGDSKDAPEGQAIGDHLNRLTGGRLSGFMEGARSQNSKKDIEGYNDRFTKPANTEKGGENKSSGVSTGRDAATNAQKQVGDVTAKVSTPTAGVNRTATNANTAVTFTKSGLSGTTGLGV